MAGESNLKKCTLELGGKSALIIAEDKAKKNLTKSW